MTTGKPPKMRTVKRGPPANDEGKRGFETKSKHTKKSIKNIKQAPRPSCPSQINYILLTNNPPGWGDIYNTITHNTTARKKTTQNNEIETWQK